MVADSTIRAVTLLLSADGATHEQIERIKTILTSSTDPMLTYRQAATILRCSTREISRRVARGSLPVVRLGHRTALIPESAIQGVICQPQG